MTNGRGIRGGDNIALKIPTYRHDETVAFYRDTLCLPFEREEFGSSAFDFGENTLSLDHVPPQRPLGRPDPGACRRCRGRRRAPHCRRRPLREEVEPHDDVPGYWISDPVGVVIRLSPT
jgi:hypothetical protein